MLRKRWFRVLITKQRLRCTSYANADNHQPTQPAPLQFRLLNPHHSSCLKCVSTTTLHFILKAHTLLTRICTVIKCLLPTFSIKSTHISTMPWHNKTTQGGLFLRSFHYHLCYRRNGIKYEPQATVPFQGNKRDLIVEREPEDLRWPQSHAG